MESDKALLLEGNIVVIEGMFGDGIVLRLTEEVLIDNIFKCLDMNFIKIREATLIEKQFWFEGYDKSDVFALPLNSMTEWVMFKIAYDNK